MRRIRWAALGVAMVTLVACGSGGGTTSTDDEGDTPVTGDGDDGDAPDAESVELRVGYLPVTGAAALFAGIEEGFFEEEGLVIEPVETASASLLPGLVAGELDIAFSNPPSSILARSNGLPIQVVAPMAQWDADACIIQVLAADDSAIEEPGDLEGVRVAADALFQLPHLSALNAAASLGVDSAAIEFVEIPYPAQIEAGDSGQVDAIMVTEPFLTIAQNQGYRPVLSVCEGLPEGATASMWVSTESYIADNADVIERFERAAVRSSEFAAGDADALRELIPTFTPVSEELAGVIVLPAPSTELNEESFDIYATALAEAGQIEEGFDVSGLLVR